MNATGKFLLVTLGVALCAMAAPPHMPIASTGDPQRASVCDRAPLSSDIAHELRSLYRTQTADGTLQFRGTQTFYESNPLLATLCLYASREVDDPAFLSQSVAAIARHYQSLFSARDRNGNLRLESHARGSSGTSVLVEDIRFNSLLALDLQSLSHLYLRIRKPMRALFWYAGARTLQRSIVSDCFDIDSGFLYPYAVREQSIVRIQNELSSLPVLFPGLIGDNHRTAIVSNYVVDSARNVGATLARSKAPAGQSVDMLRAALLIDVLGAASLHDKATTTRMHAQEAIISHPNPVTAHGRFLRCHLLSGVEPLYGSNPSLAILRDIVRAKRLFPDNEIVRIATDIDEILTFLGRAHRASGRVTEAGGQRLSKAIRNIYGVVSKVRVAVDNASFFTSQDTYELSGVAHDKAMNQLFDDVTFVLRRADNELCRQRYRKMGFSVTMTLLDERAVSGGGVRTLWTMHAQTVPITITSAQVKVGDKSVALISATSSITLKPGDDPVSIPLRISIPRGDIDSLNPFTATLLMTDGDGTHSRFHFFRTAYLEHPVDVQASFPEGRTLSGTELPIDIRVTRRTREQISVRAAWYSAGGLRLREGANTVFRFSEDDDTIQVRYHVLVPKSCRPGTFSFRMKFFGNEQEIGVIDTELFYHFQWLAIGPFTPTDAPLKTKYPPDRSIDLYRSYTGLDGTVTWGVLGARAYRSAGEVSMRSILRRPAVAYLYTIVHSSYGHETPVLLSSNVPASLFVNGRRVIDDASRSAPDPSYERVYFSEGLNDILIKVHGGANARVSFNLGNDSNLAPDEFNNNLWELIDGFQEFRTRSRDTFAAADEAHQVVALRYSDPDANSVSVVGSFNGWSPDQSPMRKLTDNTWEITLSLTPGRYGYRFLVNNRKQILDPNQELTEPDGYGGRNSVIIVDTN